MSKISQDFRPQGKEIRSLNQLLYKQRENFLRRPSRPAHNQSGDSMRLPARLSLFLILTIFLASKIALKKETRIFLSFRRLREQLSLRMRAYRIKFLTMFPMNTFKTRTLWPTSKMTPSRSRTSSSLYTHVPPSKTLKLSAASSSLFLRVDNIKFK